MAVALILVSLLAVTQAQIRREKVCPLVKSKLDTINHADLTGIWYGYAQYPLDEGTWPPMTCLRAFVREDGSALLMDIAAKNMNSGSDQKILTMLQPYPQTASYYGEFPSFEGPIDIPLGHVVILDTDYWNYMIVWQCRDKYSKKNDISDRTAWVATRKPFLPLHLIKHVFSVLSHFKIDISELQLVDQSSCSYFYLYTWLKPYKGK